MRFFIYTAIFFGLLLTGCINTEGTIKIKGKIMDEYTKKPIPFRDIIIQGLVDINDGRLPIEAGQISTDSSGYFSYTLKKVKDAYFYNFCFVGDSSYALLTREISLFDLQDNADYLFFSLSSLADLTIKIYRKTETPAYDTLLLSWKTDGIDGRTLYPYKIENYGLTPSSELTWIGGNIKSTIKTRAFADKKATVRWMLFRNRQNIEIIDTITCRKNIVNEVNLKY